MNALVIGATGVAGTAAIEAFRQTHPQSHISAMWFGKPDPELQVSGADLTLFGDITDPSTIDALVSQRGDTFDWVFYATALGDVGFPIEDATAEQIAHSNRLSFDPMPMLVERLNIANIVGYSTFYTLPHQRVTYGAMGYSKECIEKWVVATAEGTTQRWAIRAGAFKSASSQGIKLLVRRRAKELAASDNPLLSELFKDRKSSEAIELLMENVHKEEQQELGDTGTDGESLRLAHLQLLEGPEAPIVNVAGKKIWVSNEPLLIQGSSD